MSENRCSHRIRLPIFVPTIHNYDQQLVIVAAALCLLATFTTFAIFEQGRRSGSHCAGWVALTAPVSGLGIWSTYFVAMLAYGPASTLGYDFDRILLSISAAVAIGFPGWWICNSAGRGAHLWPD